MDDHEKTCACGACGGALDRPMDSDCWLPDVLFERWSKASNRPELRPLDFAELGRRRFVHGLLPFPVEGGDTFRVGIWIEVDGFTFERVKKAWGKPSSYVALAFEGRLANDVRLFGTRTLGVEVRARARRAEARPFVERAFDPALAALLRQGWSEAQYQEVVQAVAKREAR